jgi:hypothetical protein
MNIKPVKVCKVISFLAIFLISGIFITCNDNDNKEPDPLVGNYIFSGAAFEETVNIIVGGNPQTFNPGSDASVFVSNGLLGTAPCEDSTNAAISFRKDGKSFFICRGETNESQMGTWIINEDRSVLTLNISNPMPLALDIVDLNLTETVISGKVNNFPLPLSADEPLGALIGNPPHANFQVKKVTVEFTRIP